MVENPQSRSVPPWLYKLFTGQQYPYVRRLAKFDKKDRSGSSEPTPEEIDAKFWEVFPRCSVRILQEVKTGMIVNFEELGSYPPGGYQELIEAPEEFLAREYGKKKIKINFYDGENFVCTINFKVGGWTGHEE
ncbi:MAG: hypothetical protein D6704_10025 [Nitrospirae bacterium]|nr:MAG: hypothetical protein D6704_10025 [Nitrospirota bacterium]